MYVVCMGSGGTSVLGLQGTPLECAVEVEVDLACSVGQGVGDYVFKVLRGGGVAGGEGVDVCWGEGGGAGEGCEERGEEGEGGEFHGSGGVRKIDGKLWLW